MIVKIAGTVLISASGLFLGMYMSGRLKKRRELLEKMQVFLNTAATSVRYSSDDIFRVTGLCARSCGLDGFEFDSSDAPFQDLWRSEIKALSSKYHLNNSDRELLTELGNSLGTTDAEGQLHLIELYKSLLAKQLEAAEAEQRQKTRVYVSVGLFSGLSLAIVLI